MLSRCFAGYFLSAILGAAQTAPPASGSVKDPAFFLRRLRTIDHLPELERSHTAMASTWDRSGGNRDGLDFKQIIDDRNVLLDLDGPGCIHRIFTGRLGAKVAGTRIQIFLDHDPRPLFDLEVDRFFDDKNGPIPYPLVFHKTYPGTLFPIPFARHCRVQLVSSEPDREKRRWGNFWQIAYTTYPPGTQVRSLRWPLNARERQELDAVCRTWLAAESSPPPAPSSWAVEKRLAIAPGEAAEVRIDGRGVIREIRISIEPAAPELLRNLRMRMTWDGAAFPSVDVPVGYFFGNADYPQRPDAQFSSLLLGVTGTEAYCRFPMPFDGVAVLSFLNNSGRKVENLAVRLDVQRLRRLPSNWARFHATWTERKAHGPELERLPRYGARRVPVHVVLERAAGPGKYVGVLLHVGWPHKSWWGEGDWLIWTDEDGWPPSYHGTGSEEYFNSGWCEFDRKAVSGFVAKDRPGDVAVYTFHLNDAFQFQHSVRAAVEIWKLPDELGVWGSTAYWYALPARPAEYSAAVLHRSRLSGAQKSGEAEMIASGGLLSSGAKR